MMGENGVLFLRAVRASPWLELDLETGPNPRADVRSVLFSIRNRAGAESRLDVAIDAARSTVRLPLPQSGAGLVYELSWRFSYSNCVGPTRCSSGTLHAARFAED